MSTRWICGSPSFSISSPTLRAGVSSSAQTRGQVRGVKLWDGMAWHGMGNVFAALWSGRLHLGQTKQDPRPSNSKRRPFSPPVCKPVPCPQALASPIILGGSPSARQIRAWSASSLGLINHPRVEFSDSLAPELRSELLVYSGGSATVSDPCAVQRWPPMLLLLLAAVGYGLWATG
ncbi:hypothetical protein CIB48_g3368 [Xylaria polymorpha]|nr:hypothetical protein CIB48_g3368 [Xylaria polymorpha]